MAKNPKNPGEDDDKGLSEFFGMFGGREEAEGFMADAEFTAQVEAWKGVHEMYVGLKAGGFSRSEAMELIVLYMIKVLGS